MDPAEEIQRLATVFDFVKNREKTPFSPRFSIDTYHFETARKALENGFDLLNDIHGLDDPEMLSLAKEHKDKPCIFMHNRDLTGLPLKIRSKSLNNGWKKKSIFLNKTAFVRIT